MDAKNSSTMKKISAKKIFGSKTTRQKFSGKKILALLALLAIVLPVRAIRTDDLVWHAADTLPLFGTLSPADTAGYIRIPSAVADTMRAEMGDLARNTAGMYIRFASDASAIGAHWKARKCFNMNHMTAAGIRGLDLYTRLDDGTWTTVSSARPAFYKKNTQTMVITDMKPQMREYMLYLPLYDGVDSIYIGVDSAATVVRPTVDSPRAGKPIIMYGTSILQGGCASRPGMVHTSILSRRLDREVINLGFSGNGRLDPAIAQLIAAADPSIVVIDVLPNVKTPDLLARMPGFMATIRRSHPDVPVVLVESPIFPLMRFNMETLETISEKNRALRSCYDRLRADGDKNVYYFEGADILGDCVEGTVDNYHFTDLGFTRFADNLEPLLRTLLNGGK